jgi:hypothetical protein
MYGQRCDTHTHVDLANSCLFRSAPRRAVLFAREQRGAFCDQSDVDM